MNKETIKKDILSGLAVIKIYCDTVKASGYSNDVLNVLKSEFQPILNQLNLIKEGVEKL